MVGMTKEQQRKLVDDAATALGEHFNAVQILVSQTELGRTRCIKSGVGDWYSRQGMAHEFINEDVARENAVQIATELNPPDDGWKTA